jgi:hypothetical protein
VSNIQKMDKEWTSNRANTCFVLTRRLISGSLVNLFRRLTNHMSGCVLFVS